VSVARGLPNRFLPIVSPHDPSEHREEEAAVQTPNTARADQRKGNSKVMETRFATHNGCIRNTATVDKSAQPSQAEISSPPPSPATATASGLGGQIGELTAALNIIGWNHNRMPPEERIPVQEKI